MKEADELRRYATYVVRVSREGSGLVHGVVVRITTGERLGFEGAQGAADLLQAMITADIATSGRTPTGRADLTGGE